MLATELVEVHKFPTPALYVTFFVLSQTIPPRGRKNEDVFNRTVMYEFEYVSQLRRLYRHIKIQQATHIGNEPADNFPKKKSIYILLSKNAHTGHQPDKPRHPDTRR